MKTFAPLSLLLAVVVSFAASAAQAQVATSPPAIRIAQASHVSVASGQAFYTGSSAQPRSWSAPNPLIISAARRLQNNPDRIYEFVHNGIETEPVFGLAKGAVGTLVNRRNPVRPSRADGQAASGGWLYRPISLRSYHPQRCSICIMDGNNICDCGSGNPR